MRFHFDFIYVIDFRLRFGWLRIKQDAYDLNSIDSYFELNL